MQFEIVPFHDDQIEAIRGADGRAFASVKRICENLRVNFSTQLSKLKNAPWSGVVILQIPDLRGRDQGQSVIPIDALPMWLATIHSGKVAADLRGKLERYQLEARDVLARHFMPAAPRPKSTKSTLDLLAMGRILVDNLEKHAELEEFVHERDTYHEQRNRELEARLARTQEELIQARSDSARAVRTVTSESGYFTLVTWAEQHGVYLTPPNDSLEGKVVKAMCLDRGIEPGQWKGPRYSVGTYPEHILYLWLDNYRGRGTSLRVASPA